jgi:DNA invertase Pin-like site-specific DNA recombinase
LGPGEAGIMANKPPADVSIGKFDILATYVYTQELLNGLSDEDAKQRGMVAAIMGAQARLGIRKEHHEEFKAQKEAAEKKKKTTITAESFNKQVADKVGKFFDEVFLPSMKKLVEAGLSYDEVKRLVKIPTTWGAKIKGDQFEERASKFVPK